MRFHKKYALLTFAVACSIFIASASAVSYFTLTWSFSANGEIQLGALDSFGNAVYFGERTSIGRTNYLYAVNITNGQRLWRYNASLPINYVSHFNYTGIESVVAGTGGSTSLPNISYVIAFSSSNNATLWNSINLVSSVISVGAVESNTTNTDDIMAGLANGTIVRLSGNNGGILWKYNGNGTVLSVSNLKGGSVIAGSFDLISGNGHVYCLEMNGTLRWSFPPSSSPIASRPLLKVFKDVTGDGVPEVIAAFHDGEIHLLNGKTGQEVSPWPFNSPGGYSITDLLCTQDYTGDGFRDIIAATDNGTLLIVNGQNASLFRGPTIIATSTVSYIQYMYFYEGGKRYLNRTLAVSAVDSSPSFYSIRGINATTLSTMKQYNTSGQALNLFNTGNHTSSYTGDLIFTAKNYNYVYNISGTDIIVPEFPSNFMLVILMVSMWFLLLFLRKRS